MMTFVHRDRRLVNVEEAFLASDARIAEIEAAIAGFPPDGDAAELAALQASRETAIETGGRISAERDQLVTDRFEVSDEAALAIAADWIWQTTSDMLASVAADPALVVRQMTSGIAPDTAAAIEALPRAPGLPRAGFLDEVLAAGGAETLGTLTGFALGQWLRQPLDVRNYPFRDIGVVLPLRLETLFDEQADGSWLMSLRVVPDEPSIRRDQTKVTALEAEFLRQFCESRPRHGSRCEHASRLAGASRGHCGVGGTRRARDCSAGSVDGSGVSGTGSGGRVHGRDSA